MATVSPSTSPIGPGRSFKSPSRQRWIVLTASVIIVLGCITLHEFRVPGQEFNQQLWEEFGDFNRGSRYPPLEMADRLVAEGTLRGKTRDEIFRMLGEPPKTDYFRDWDLVYWLGPERGFMRIDSEWLVIRFDTQGQVTECRIVRD
jgi:hypothetical protein